MADTPNAIIPLVPQDVLDPAAGLNQALDVLDALVQTAVIDMALTAPPGSPTDGDLYIVGATATGDWVGEDGNMARWVDDPGYWQFYPAGDQVRIVLNNADGALYVYNGGVWVAASGSAAAQPTSGLWVYNTGTTIADPGSGNIRTDDTPALSTTLAISGTTDKNIVASRILRTLSTGDVLFIQQRTDETNWGRFVLDGAPVDQGGWFEIPVTFAAGGGTVTKNVDVIVWAQWLS